MAQANAAKSGSFKVGGDIKVNRLGFGAMRITGAGIWGPPADREEALRTLKRLPDLGIDFVDTADSYGPDMSELLIHEALHPYKGMLIATKAGFRRPDPANGRPTGAGVFAPAGYQEPASRLGVERIDLWQLHRIDPKVPRAEQFDAIRSLLDDGIIRHTGLSEVSRRRHRSGVEGLRGGDGTEPLQSRRPRQRGRARTLRGERYRLHPVVPARRRRSRQARLAARRIAKRHKAAPGQIALAWVLRRSTVMLPIPGTSKLAHLEENVAAVNIVLSDEEFGALDREGRVGAVS